MLGNLIVLTATLRHFPPELPLITDCLAALGLLPGSASVTLRPDRCRQRR